MKTTTTATWDFLVRGKGVKMTKREEDHLREDEMKDEKKNERCAKVRLKRIKGLKYDGTKDKQHKLIPETKSDKMKKTRSASREPRSQAGATTKSITLRSWYLPSRTATHTYTTTTYTTRTPLCTRCA